MRDVEVRNSLRAVKRLNGRQIAEPIRLMDHGKIVAYILPVNQYDEQDIEYITDPRFWKMIQERRKSDEGVSLEVVMSDLEAREKAEKGRGLRLSKQARAMQKRTPKSRAASLKRSV